MTRWRTLLLATAGFNLTFLVWFSFAPFLGPIRESFGLSLAAAGLLTSAAFWLVPVGRVVVGWLSDRWGATTVFSIVLVYVGLASVASAYVTNYYAFFGLRLVVGTAGVAFVIGAQHVAQWFPEEQLGTAEGVYAGIGNAGAGLGALALPWVFGTDWRTAFVVTGIASVLLGVAYYLVGEDAATEAAATEAADGATLRGLLAVGTRPGVVALSVAYVMSFGLVLSMNGWLPTYFERSLGADVALAGLLAGTFGIASGLLRPIGGYASDRLVRTERDLLPILTGQYREQWTVACLAAVVALLGALAAVGSWGGVAPVLGVVVLLGVACGWAGGAIFAQVPELVPEQTGAVAGVIGGVGTFGGVAYPLAFAWAAGIGDVHWGYLLVAASMLPILAINVRVFGPDLEDEDAATGAGGTPGGVDPVPGSDD